MVRGMGGGGGEKTGECSGNKQVFAELLSCHGALAQIPQ